MRTDLRVHRWILPATGFVFTLTFGSCDHKPPTPINAPKPRYEVPEIPSDVDVFFPIKTGNDYPVYSLIDSIGHKLIPSRSFKKCSQAFIPRSFLISHFIGQRSVMMLGHERWLFVSQGITQPMPPAIPTSDVKRIINCGESLFRVDCRKSVSESGSVVCDPTDQWSASTDVIPWHTFSEGRYLVKQGDKFGYVDRSGRWIILPQFDQAGSFFEGRAPVCQDDRWGYVDSIGDVVIDLKFEGVSYFDDGVALVKQPDRNDLTLIDSAGTERGSLQRSAIGLPKGLFPGFLNGTLFHADRVNSNHDFVYGFIKPDGEWLFEPNLLQEGFASRFLADHAIARMPSGKNLYDFPARVLRRTGEAGARLPNRFPPAYWNPFLHGLAGDRECQYGYVDPEGNFVWQP